MHSQSPTKPQAKLEAKPNGKAFPIPVVAFGPGSQAEDEGLDYITLPSGMHTFQPPLLPEPEAVQGHEGALRALDAVLASLQAAVRGEPAPPVPLGGLSAADLALVHQVLGEGEVSAQVLPAPGRPQAQVQESVFAGVWRVVEVLADGQVRDRIEIARLPALLAQAAREDEMPAQALPAPPPAVMNAPALLAELADQRQHWRAGQPPHVINLTLLPLGPGDIAWLDHVLGTGRVLILSRGYGNCRITNTGWPNTWRLVYYNSQDVVILNTVEVTALPEVACAASEDLADSLERFTDVMAWVRQDM